MTPTSLAQTLPIDRLDAHPSNSNKMPDALLDKLADEIGRTGLYPPVIVRAVGGRYQIMDGHHRVAVLNRLGHRLVQAVVWEADDEQALLLLATLNRLRGDDDPRKRAALLGELNQSMGVHELAHRLPENAERVRKLLSLNAAPPSPKPATKLEEMPVSLHFFMLPAQRRAVEQRLRAVEGPREQALLTLLGLTEATNDDR